MTVENFGKEQWVALFREIGLSESRMKQWHQLFEQRHAAAHQAFLEWLGLPESEVVRIRALSREE
ncbi:MAG: hypothetical protein HQL74_14855 [Magnetococcales bacterium]|nr:hypothetical protein [Magnetococcales bacterium]